MPRSHHPAREPRSSNQPSPLFRTRNWLGQERIAFVYRKRRYAFRRVEAATWARHRITQARRSYTGCMLLIAMLIVLLSSVWLVSLQPALLLSAVDAARAVVGPGPVAAVESQVFRVATLVRGLRVRLGETKPGWSVQGAVATEHMPTAVPIATSTPTPTFAPTTTALPTATPAPTAPPELVAIVRGGNLRREPLLNDANVLGWVMPGDQLELLGRDELWIRVRLLAAGNAQNTQPIPPGTEGWISTLLLEAATATPLPPTPAPPTATPAPTAPLLFNPTPLLPTAPVAPSAPPEPTVATPAIAPPPANAWGLAPIPAVVGDGMVANEGQWQLLPAAADNGTPAMAVTTFRPDPARPDIQVAIAAIDLSRSQLHMVAGTLEPEADPNLPSPPRDGRIPVADYGRLLAAFNGGFKALHGSDGMGVNGVVYRPAINDRATVAVYTDGTTRIGLLGRDLSLDGAIAWRQNGQLLVENGQVTAQALEGGPGWGASVDKQVETWRSGLGISTDGRTLFFAVGDALTSARLAESLRAAGVWNALQLDINNYWVRFVTFQRNENGQPFAQALISAMPQVRAKYLGAEERDFMYVTLR